MLNFVNADLIAGGLSPLKPELAAIAAARLVLKGIARLVEERADFAFESTLSGLSYISRLRDMKQRGYHVEPSPGSPSITSRTSCGRSPARQSFATYAIR